jgi:hypothetical protein
MDHYDGVSFYNADGSFNLNDNGVQQTYVLKKLGLEQTNSKPQMIEGLRIYPTDVLTPEDPKRNPIAYTKNTLAIHHFEASHYDGELMEQRIITLHNNREFWDKYCHDIMRYNK